MKHGTGRFIDRNNTIRYDGMWEKNQKQGQGKLTNFQKSQIILGIWDSNQIVEVISTQTINQENNDETTKTKLQE